MKFRFAALLMAMAMGSLGAAACGDDTASVDGETPSPTGTAVETTAGVFDDPAEFRVRLEFPVTWTRDLDYDLRFGGEDGFVSIGAQQSPGGLEGAVDAIAYHKLQPYGSDPQIDAVTVDGADGRIIRPSADQHPDLKGQVALVLARQPALSVRGETYSYLVIEADEAHFNAIVASISLYD